MPDKTPISRATASQPIRTKLTATQYLSPPTPVWRTILPSRRDDTLLYTIRVVHHISVSVHVQCIQPKLSFSRIFYTAYIQFAYNVQKFAQLPLSRQDNAEHIPQQNARRQTQMNVFACTKRKIMHVVAVAAAAT